MSATPLSQYKFRWAFIIWWLTWASLQAWILYNLGFPAIDTITDSFITNLLLAAGCVLVSNNLQYYLPQRDRHWYILVMSLIVCIVWMFLIKMVVPLVLKSNADYLVFFSKSITVRFGISFLLIGCMAMISVLWYTFEEQKANTKRKSDAEQLTKDAELYKLRQQLQPHFLFNSLNSINALIGTRPAEARKMVQQLSEFLRGTLKREEHQWITLEEEINYLQLYLEIEKVRFGNRLSTIFETSGNSLPMKIPAMLLQPLVENAIKFGLYDTTGETLIHIATDGQANMLVVRVQNPFDPETSQPNQGTGFGLSSIRRRLYLLFARNDLLETKVNENLFTTTVKIPQAV